MDKSNQAMEFQTPERDAGQWHTLSKDHTLYDVAIEEVEQNGKFPSQAVPSGSERSESMNAIVESEHQCSVGPIRCLPYNPPSTNLAHSSRNETENKPRETIGPAMIYLSSANAEEWENLVASVRTGVALTGSAATGNAGPVIGMLDIGESDDSYLFRVSLPGVKRDEREFSCEVESKGKVLIRGVTTTGKKTVHRHSQVFEMQTRNLCPPGRFSISFQLPGPVNPQKFSGKFGIDGVLEGMVMKEDPTRD